MGEGEGTEGGRGEDEEGGEGSEGEGGGRMKREKGGREKGVREREGGVYNVGGVWNAVFTFPLSLSLILLSSLPPILLPLHFSLHLFFPIV